MVDFYEFFLTSNAIEDVLDVTSYNLVNTAIPKWRMFKLIRWEKINPLITFERISGFG
jgi:hypothetical protein